MTEHSREQINLCKSELFEVLADYEEGVAVTAVTQVAASVASRAMYRRGKSDD